MLPSMPLLFSTSRDSVVTTQENITADDKQVSPKEKKSFVSIPVSNELPSISFESIPEDEKECDDELVLMAENASIGEKRKTQTQSTPTRKKKKIELIEPLLEDRINNDEQANHFATSYFMKAKAELDESTFLKFISVLSEVNEGSTNIISLYNEMMGILSKNPDLAEEFIGFLDPHQALEVQKFSDFIHFESRWNFFRKIDAFHLNKVYHLLEQHMLNPSITTETIKNSLLSAFKGHPNIAEGLLYLLPGGKPPTSCKDDFEDISDLGTEENSMWAKLNIPDQSNRGCSPDVCDCACHLCVPKKFCTFCNIKFSNGQIYVQTGKGLRFAKVTFRGCQQEDVLYQLNPNIYSKLPVEERKRTKSVSHQTKNETSHASEPPHKSEIIVEKNKDADKLKKIDLIELTKEAVPAELEENGCEVAIELVLPLVQNEEIICISEENVLEEISNGQMCIVLDNALETNEDNSISILNENDVPDINDKVEIIELDMEEDIKMETDKPDDIKMDVTDNVSEIIVIEDDINVNDNKKKDSDTENEMKDNVIENEMKDNVNENEMKDNANENEMKDSVNENGMKDNVNENEMKSNVNENEMKCNVNENEIKANINKNEMKDNCNQNEIQLKGKISKTKEEKLENKPRLWTREEDKLILQAFQKQLSTEQTFSRISDLMPNRTVEDIQGRFQVLMNLLEQMTSGSSSNYPS